MTDPDNIYAFLQWLLTVYGWQVYTLIILVILRADKLGAVVRDMINGKGEKPDG